MLHLHAGRESWLKKWVILGNLALWAVLVLDKVLFQCFLSPLRDKFMFCSKTLWHMFLLVSGPSRWAPMQHGVSIQISINLFTKFPPVSCQEKLVWSKSWRESLHVYLLSFPRFRMMTFSRLICRIETRSEPNCFFFLIGKTNFKLFKNLKLFHLVYFSGMFNHSQFLILEILGWSHWRRFWEKRH